MSSQEKNMYHKLFWNKNCPTMFLFHQKKEKRRIECNDEVKDSWIWKQNKLNSPWWILSVVIAVHYFLYERKYKKKFFSVKIDEFQPMSFKRFQRTK